MSLSTIEDASLEVRRYSGTSKLLGWIGGVPVVHAEDRGRTSYSPVLRVISYRLPDDPACEHSTTIHACSFVPLNYAQFLAHRDPARGVDHFVVLCPTHRALRYIDLMQRAVEHGPANLSPVQRAEFAAKSALLNEEGDSLPVDLRRRLTEWRDDPDFPLCPFERAILWPPAI